ncbi:efflux transporter outer membrane subunit [Massilia sp. S19_KUP03_FR1]|uniref:efflux transporter outer membrane subunit n=1 Tax=Massilia sp. S19_KUP03_FR1 TaxID=3025503 RepID=UPI002FCCFF9F
MKPMFNLSMMMAALVLAGCSMAPVLKAPDVAVPVAFKEAGTPLQAADGSSWQVAQPAEAQPRGQWWLVFNDSALTTLVEEATGANASLAAAAARVHQARAIAGIAQAQRSIKVDAGVGAQRGRASTTSLGLPDGASVPVGNAFQAQLSASYEVDLFGRVANNVNAAQADAAASEATWRSVLLALQADVAQNYFRLRATDAELATLAKNVDLRLQSVKVNQSRFDNGDIGEFDLVRAKSELATARAEELALARQRANLEHALAVLLGRPAAQFAALANPLLADALPAIPAGMPSTLLQRRPDVAAAQRALVAANARIGEARAAMFPALNLSAQGGGASSALSNMLQWSSRSWLLGALMSLPVIDGGRNRNNVTRSQAVLEESVANYRQNVLVAFSEVEDNLAGLRILASQAEQVEAGVVFARRSADLAQKLYDAGRSSYLDLLDAQRNLSLVERNAAQLRGERAVTTVALIRALGGDWGNDQPLPQTIAQQ